MKIIKLFRRLTWVTLLSVSFLWTLPSCSHSELNKDDPEAMYQDAEEAYKDEKYLTALEKFRDVKNRFPYSSRAVDAELRIADTYFEQESYIEAESAYEVFKELHPTHPKSDYVQYQIGMSYYNQIPSNTSRDLSAAYKAIEAFTLLQEKYPSSEFAEKSKNHIADARKKLAEHENYVADFYFQKKHYLSASYRYAALLHDYPNLGYDEEALFRLAQCYYNTKMFANAEDALKRLIAQYPNTSHRSVSEDLLGQIKKTGG